MFSWLESYLTGRSIYMSTHDGSTSSYILAKGVPQGGVLSPILFNMVLINLICDLPTTVHASIYADDICIWATGVTRPQIRARLQSALKITHKYLIERALQISTSKSAAITFSRKLMDRYPITICGEKIPYVRKHTLLGITLDRGLTWTPHVSRLKMKLTSIVHFMRFISSTT